ncbi:methylated-DNA--[protein]-cysteine S-methyltransferase [Microbacteriaceae bacterium VKM Ac-2854]|nr:methylated-DNA--[protein]-cysteine S-methyltransferase [Microbacteriaceae bacterium VKM Ac-2854]
MTHTRIPTPVGELLLVAEDAALTGLYFPGHRYPPAADSIGDDGGDAVFDQTARQLAEYFAGERTDFDLPLAPRGDPFSQQVWAILRAIPFGSTTSYGVIARELGNPALAQRVGQAVGHNPISIIVPCHRVLGADGSLTGFAGGLERKKFLLELEEPATAKAERLF